VLIAVCHWIFFHFLDRKRVGHPIAQSYVSAISTAFITAFGAALVASLSTALTQSLWQLLRTHPMRISTIDNLFAITSSPLQLLSWDVLRSAPFICFAAVVSFCIPAAMSFPPGALIVVLSPSIQTFNATVPYFSPSYFGNGSYTDEMDNTLFEFDSYHSYA
jgi:predicted PurR-regulated permease PerM